MLSLLLFVDVADDASASIVAVVVEELKDDSDQSYFSGVVVARVSTGFCFTLRLPRPPAAYWCVCLYFFKFSNNSKSHKAATNANNERRKQLREVVLKLSFALLYSCHCHSTEVRHCEKHHEPSSWLVESFIIIITIIGDWVLYGKAASSPVKLVERKVYSI